MEIFNGNCQGGGGGGSHVPLTFFLKIFLIANAIKNFHTFFGNIPLTLCTKIALSLGNLFHSQVEDGTGSGSTSQGWLAKKADDWLPSLTKKQRIIGFMTSLVLGMICFGLAVSFLPMLLINPRKFSLLFSLGSAFTLSSFSFLWGPYIHLVHLLSRERLPFTSIYLSSLILTLYFAMGLQSAILTPIAACAQVILKSKPISK